MAKNFTKEDILKKNQTNVKSATSTFALVGILGIAYIIRYFVTKNFNFYFSLTFTELMLRYSDAGKLPSAVSVGLVAVYLVVFIIVAVLSTKNAKNLKLAFGFYAFDSLCLIPMALFHGSGLQSDFFIDVIIHLLALLFLVVGVLSAKKCKE